MQTARKFEVVDGGRGGKSAVNAPQSPPEKLERTISIRKRPDPWRVARRQRSRIAQVRREDAKKVLTAFFVMLFGLFLMLYCLLAPAFAFEAESEHEIGKMLKVVCEGKRVPCNELGKLDELAQLDPGIPSTVRIALALIRHHLGENHEFVRFLMDEPMHARIPTFSRVPDLSSNPRYRFSRGVVVPFRGAVVVAGRFSLRKKQPNTSKRDVQVVYNPYWLRSISDATAALVYGAALRLNQQVDWENLFDGPKEKGERIECDARLPAVIQMEQILNGIAGELGAMKATPAWLSRELHLQAQLSHEERKLLALRCGTLV